MERLTFTDRYLAAGTPYPNCWTGCRVCEGLGLYPIEFSEWEELERAEEGQPPIFPQHTEDGGRETFPPADGWLFAFCKECNGTGRQITGPVGDALDLAFTYVYPFRFAYWLLKRRDLLWSAPEKAMLMAHLKAMVPAVLSVLRDQRVQRQLLKRRRAAAREQRKEDG